MQCSYDASRAWMPPIDGHGHLACPAASRQLVSNVQEVRAQLWVAVEVLRTMTSKLQSERLYAQ
jgi:hypothetical protein